MIIETEILIFSITILILLVQITSQSYSNCNQFCDGGGSRQLQHVPYPFGFSPNCQIQLNCTPAGVFIGEFPIRTITPDKIIINIKAECNRSVHSLRDLFGQNYAPTTDNGVLLQNCSSSQSSCTLPPITAVQTNFQSFACNSTSNNVSCFSESRQNNFLNYDNVLKKNCQYLLSAISVVNSNSSEVYLEVQVIQLGWWLEGICDQCSHKTNCTKIVSPVNGREGYRCQCDGGLVGDGYRDGVGCREASSCSASKYMSGQCGGTTRIEALIGGILFGVFLMVTFGLIYCYFRRKSLLKRNKCANRQIRESKEVISIPIYPYKDIEKATNYFSEKQRLGTGAYGTVYSGKLHKNHELVAIKRIKHRDNNTIEQVMNEITLLSSVQHPNLVRLLGCSIDKGEQILVYEFMPNGTLAQHLHRTLGDGLPWPIRLNIATETARAIAHLHFDTNPPIYHRDIKSSNILLDNNFNSKVADFGLSRLGFTESSHISTAPQGTPGYVDPQYHQDFHLSDKSDVYSFGVVLIEIITSMKVVDFSRPQNEVNLAAIAIDRINKGCLDEIIDPFLLPNRDAWTLSSVHKVAELAFRCLAFHRDMRPTMLEVSAELEQIRPNNTEHAAFNEKNRKESGLSEASFYSSTSNLSEQPLSSRSKKDEPKNRGFFSAQNSGSFKNSVKRTKGDSPISMEDSWLSEQSSATSSKSLVSNVVR